MNNTNTQPDAGSQEADSTPVANNLGKIDEYSLADFVKSNFLNEEEAAPAKEEQQAEPEVETEETAEAEPEVEAQAEADQSTDEEGEPEESSLSRGVQKRINKLVAAKKAAQAQLEEREARLAQMERELQALKSVPQTSAPTVSDAVEALGSVEEVNAELQRALYVLDWCEDNPDGGVITDPQGNQIELDNLQVRDMRKLARRRKEIELPARFQYLNQKSQIEPVLAAKHPWMRKPESEEYRVAQQVLRDFPEVKRRPDHMHLVAALIEGLKVFAERDSGKAKAAPIKRAPAQPSVKAPPKVDKDDSSRAQKSFLKDPSSRDGLSDLVKAMGFV
jgi:hypothetical protein